MVNNLVESGKKKKSQKIIIIFVTNAYQNKGLIVYNRWNCQKEKKKL